MWFTNNIIHDCSNGVYSVNTGEIMPWITLPEVLPPKSENADFGGKMFFGP